jgi:hypothetical protein
MVFESNNEQSCAVDPSIFLMPIPSQAGLGSFRGGPNQHESINMSYRKITKNRGAFPSDASLINLFYLALRNISERWNRPIKD